MRILLTGASGCIGHYLAEALIQETEDELFLLVRNPGKLTLEFSRPGIHILQGDLREIDRFAEILGTINVAILAATAWGGTREVFDTNVTATWRLIQLLDPKICQQIIYFSTASILDVAHRLLPQAGEIGTDYIRSKYLCYQKLQQVEGLAIATLFPTLVLGGDDRKPKSHLTAGLPDVVKWVDLLRWFRADGSFHYIHARDIAAIALHFLRSSPIQGDFILGNDRTTVNDLVEAICAYRGKRIYLRIPLSFALANVFIVLFRIQMAAWDRFCLRTRHFSHQHPVNPASFGLPQYCPTLFEAFCLCGVEEMSGKGDKKG